MEKIAVGCVKSFAPFLQVISANQFYFQSEEPVTKDPPDNSVEIPSTAMTALDDNLVLPSIVSTMSIISVQKN